MEPEPVPDDIQNDDTEKLGNMNMRKFYPIETTKVYREALRARTPRKYPVDYTVAQSILKSEQENYLKRAGKRIIMTDRDELYRCLSRHLDRLPTRRNWITPLGILATIVIAIVSSTFKPVLGIESDTWYSIFVIAGLITFIWFIITLYIDIKSKDMKSVFEEIIEDLSRH